MCQIWIELLTVICLCKVILVQNCRLSFKRFNLMGAKTCDVPIKVRIVVQRRFRVKVVVGVAVVAASLDSASLVPQGVVLLFWVTKRLLGSVRYNFRLFWNHTACLSHQLCRAWWRLLWHTWLTSKLQESDLKASFAYRDRHHVVLQGSALLYLFEELLPIDCEFLRRPVDFDDAHKSIRLLYRKTRGFQLSFISNFAIAGDQLSVVGSWAYMVRRCWWGWLYASSRCLVAWVRIRDGLNLCKPLRVPLDATALGIVTTLILLHSLLLFCLR